MNDLDASDARTGHRRHYEVPGSSLVVTLDNIERHLSALVGFCVRDAVEKMGQLNTTALEFEKIPSSFVPVTPASIFWVSESNPTYCISPVDNFPILKVR